jgi:hypothetical protein
MMKTALFEDRTIVLEKPHRHVTSPRGFVASARQVGGATSHRHDHIRKRWPGVIEIVLRRPRRVIGMRVIKP